MPTRRAHSNLKLSGVIAELRRLGNAKTRAGLVRFGLPVEKAFGVPLPEIRGLAKRIGTNHALALELWKSGWTDARTLAAFVADPGCVTPAQMESWVRDFDSWGVCDTVCLTLFDRTPHAFAKIKAWSRRRAEFEKRAAFALLASVALHQKELADAPFLRALPWIERAATDGRNFVKKGVSWALRTIGRRNPQLHSAALALAQQLAQSSAAPPRWVGKDALRDLQRPLVTMRFKVRRQEKIERTRRPR